MKKTKLIAIISALTLITTLGASGTTFARTNGRFIGIKAAKSKALKNAKKTKSQVTFTHAFLERDDGIYIYDIEFKTKNYKYEYEIKAKNGMIISKDVDRIKNVTKKSSKYIGISKAKSIAVKHAGFTKKQVYFTKAKLENDDFMVEYEIEFHRNGIEYEYTINAKTGKIIEYDIDRDYD